ncbi:MAG: hypothetical protein ACM31C_18735 [Acidobacteriota bacterium]
MKRAALALLVVLPAAQAHAGRTLYGWLIETDTVGDGAVELGTSLYEHDQLGPYHVRSTSLAWTPAIGLLPCLELAIPVELVTRTQDDAAPYGGIARYGAELRYGFARRVPGLHPLARFALSRDVELQTQVRGELELAASYETGRVQVEGDAGLVVDVNFGHVHRELRPGAGASVLVARGLRLGGELHAELSGDATVPSWAVLGPDLAWARGRFWLAGALGFGLHAITVAPRVNLGIAW